MVSIRWGSWCGLLYFMYFRGVGSIWVIRYHYSSYLATICLEYVVWLRVVTVYHGLRAGFEWPAIILSGVEGGAARVQGSG